MTKCILIVDDEADVREVTQLGLEMGTDWTVLTASSGAEAIAIAAKHQPDAILLDMMMPDMDGRATLKHLKADPTTQNIPVILVTAKAQQSNLADFQDLAVAAILAKPFRPLKLAAEIATILNWS
jgi:CheY-like chemotaxis protein